MLPKLSLTSAIAPWAAHPNSRNRMRSFSHKMIKAAVMATPRDIAARLASLGVSANRPLGEAQGHKQATARTRFPKLKIGNLDLHTICISYHAAKSTCHGDQKEQTTPSPCICSNSSRYLASSVRCCSDMEGRERAGKHAASVVTGCLSAIPASLPSRSPFADVCQMHVPRATVQQPRARNRFSFGVGAHIATATRGDVLLCTTADRFWTEGHRLHRQLQRRTVWVS